jgi:1-pyrroline-5-carboxylate dehydrogenase
MLRPVHLRPASRAMSSVPSWATVDPWSMSAASPATGKNLVGGEWVDANATHGVIDPLNGETFALVPDTKESEAGPFIERMRTCPRSGVHNPIKNVGRYLMLGEVMVKGAQELGKPEVSEFFTQLIHRLVPKSLPQCAGEPVVTRKWMENYGSDQVRYLARSFGVPGDYPGQTSVGMRMPYGGVSVITPFNFPLEICALQACSALFMGNRPTVHVDRRVALCMEQFIRMLQHVGLPKEDIDYIYCEGPVMNKIMVEGNSRMCLFTGSQAVAEKLTLDLRGRVKLEDAGFDWKILGPDPSDVEYVVWQSDQDAYGASGQKCSAQSMLIAHENWMELGIVDKLAQQAGKRSLDGLTIGPILTWSTQRILEHIDNCLALPGAKLAFGGKPLQGHSIPDCYGAVEPTAVYIPLETILSSDEALKIATTELFGPFQVITSFKDTELPRVLELVNRVDNHLTAGVVSNNHHFLDEVLGMNMKKAGFVSFLPYLLMAAAGIVGGRAADCFLTLSWPIRLVRIVMQLAGFTCSGVFLVYLGYQYQKLAIFEVIQ